MKHAAKTALALVIIAAEIVAAGPAASSAGARDSTAQRIRHQRQLLLKQQSQIERNRQELDAQRRQLGNAAARLPAVDHGLFGDCPLGFTYYLIGGCKPDHAVIIYNGGQVGGG